MLKKIAFIKSKIKLHKRSVILCIWNMLLSAIAIPFFICMVAWVIFDGALPEFFSFGQFIFYFIIVGCCWYSCYLRRWSHSYMLDYTEKILNPKTTYCPRCFSPIKVSQQDYFFETKIGETIIRDYYSDGSISTFREPIMVKDKETLPHLACREKACSLSAKTQKDSAQATELRNKLKNNYSFYEMPRTLSATYRLIAGDRKDSYRESMKSELCSGGFWPIILFCTGILFIISLVKDLHVLSAVYGYLLGTTSAVNLYIGMIVFISICFIAIHLLIEFKANSILETQEFQEETAHFEDLEYDIYLTKRLADAKIRERKKLAKKAQKECGSATRTSPTNTHYSSSQWEKRKKAYRTTLTATATDCLAKHGYIAKSDYYNQCYILHAHSHSDLQPDCDFFITKESCVLRGSTRFYYGGHHDYIESVIADILKSTNSENVAFYIDRDLQCVRISFCILASPVFDTEEFKQQNLTEIIATYLETMGSIRKRVSPDVLATIEPDYMVIREINENGFTLQ